MDARQRASIARGHSRFSRDTGRRSTLLNAGLARRCRRSSSTFAMRQTGANFAVWTATEAEALPPAPVSPRLQLIDAWLSGPRANQRPQNDDQDLTELAANVGLRVSRDARAVATSNRSVSDTWLSDTCARRRRLHLLYGTGTCVEATGSPRVGIQPAFWAGWRSSGG